MVERRPNNGFDAVGGTRTLRAARAAAASPRSPPPATRSFGAVPWVQAPVPVPPTTEKRYGDWGWQTWPQARPGPRSGRSKSGLAVARGRKRRDQGKRTASLRRAAGAAHGGLRAGRRRRRGNAGDGQTSARNETGS